jgi:cell division control protein 24
LHGLLTPAKPNSDSDLQATEHQQELSENVAELLESNQSLSRRLMNLEDAFEVRTIVSKRQSRVIATNSSINNDASKPQKPAELTERVALDKSKNVSQLSTPLEGNAVSSFDFENDLEASRVYQKAQRDTMDFSFQSSIAYTSAWSVFSGLSLSDVSIISAIALPLYADEITNAQHYGFVGPQIMAYVGADYRPRVKTLYERCLEVELQLSQIHGFSEIFAMLRGDSEEEDPLTFLIRVFRRGAPLLMLLERIPVPGNVFYLDQPKSNIVPQKILKTITSLFIKACISELGFQPDECFSIGDLLGDDTTGSVKVRSAFSVSIR